MSVLLCSFLQFVYDWKAGSKGGIVNSEKNLNFESRYQLEAEDRVVKGAVGLLDRAAHHMSEKRQTLLHAPQPCKFNSSHPAAVHWHRILIPLGIVLYKTIILPLALEVLLFLSQVPFYHFDTSLMSKAPIASAVWRPPPPAWQSQHGVSYEDHALFQYSDQAPRCQGISPFCFLAVCIWYQMVLACF